MSKSNWKVLALTGVVLAVTPFTASRAGYLVAQPVSEASVEACVDKVRQQADYPEAGTVRHDVEVEQRRSIGHKLYISTSILEEGSGKTRQYATVCTVVPNRAPLDFRIREVGAK